MKKLRAIELKRVKQVIKAIDELSRVLNVECPVCKKVHSMKRFICSSPVTGIEPFRCPVGQRCQAFVDVTGDIDQIINAGGIRLWQMKVKLEKMLSCDHNLTADSDSGRNICTKCDAFETA